jgi:hypothetical protein
MDLNSLKILDKFVLKNMVKIKDVYDQNGAAVFVPHWKVICSCH